MRVIVVGSLGMLARDLCAALESQGYEAIGHHLPELDIRQEDHVVSCFGASNPDLVINCAAYTNVDQAESDIEPAYAVNRDGAMHIANACRTLHVPLVHISTDYVFDGGAERPYREDDETSPLGIYGLSKLEGETAVRDAVEQHYIVRTAWLYGVHGKNFVKTILTHARTKAELRVVSDQFGCPTWTWDLAETLCAFAARMAEQRPAPWGTYHCCGRGITTWHEFAELIVQEGCKREPLKTTRIVPISSEEYPTAAKRPMFSALDCRKIEKALGIELPAWQNSLKLMIASLYKP
jgi:dTDP-4-dehydrorhamnose reductase